MPVLCGTVQVLEVGACKTLLEPNSLLAAEEMPDIHLTLKCGQPMVGRTLVAALLHYLPSSA